MGDVAGEELGEKPPSGRRVSWSPAAPSVVITPLDDPPADKFKSMLAQLLASSIKNMLLLEIGLTIAYPTIVIPSLDKDEKDPLYLDLSRKSWFGSVAYICQPLGSVCSGLLLELVGRKRAMMLVNLPHLVAWFLFFWAQSLPTLFVANVLVGLSIGFMESPTLTYVGEITTPDMRGVFTSYAEIFIQIGFTIGYLLGTVWDWRTVAGICGLFPIITVIALTQVPESPIWLISKGRTAEAEESLCWLRGWTEPRVVQKELRELVEYHEKTKDKKNEMQKQRPRKLSAELHERHRGSQHFPVNYFVDLKLSNGKEVADSAKPTPQSKAADEDDDIEEDIECCGSNLSGRCGKLSALLQPKTLHPLIMVTLVFFFSHFTGLSGIRSYMIEVFEELNLPVEPHWITVIFGVVGIAGNGLLILIVKWTGKKSLNIVSLGASSAICIFIGLYTRYPKTLGTWAPLTMLVLLSFINSLGVATIPWMLLSEVFPFRTRGLASGISAAFSYVIAFGAANSFLHLKESIHLDGTFWLYGAISFIGCIYVHLKTPETEGKTLEDIENHYSGKVVKQNAYNNCTDVSTISATVPNASLISNASEIGNSSLPEIESRRESDASNCSDKTKSASVETFLSNSESQAGLDEKKDSVDTAVIYRTEEKKETDCKPPD